MKDCKAFWARWEPDVCVIVPLLPLPLISQTLESLNVTWDNEGSAEGKGVLACSATEKHRWYWSMTCLPWEIKEMQLLFTVRVFPFFTPNTIPPFSNNILCCLVHLLFICFVILFTFSYRDISVLYNVKPRLLSLMFRAVVGSSTWTDPDFDT